MAGAAPDNLLAKLQLDKEMRGIVALGFSPSGSLLAGVATDNSHTVSVWDWRNGWRLVGEGKGCMGEPPQVRGNTERRQQQQQPACWHVVALGS